MILRMVDLPEPLAPRMIFVWPLMTREAQVLEHHLLVEGQLHVVEHDHRRARLVQDFLNRFLRGVRPLSKSS